MNTFYTTNIIKLKNLSLNLRMMKVVIYILEKKDQKVLDKVNKHKGVNVYACSPSMILNWFISIIVFI